MAKESSELSILDVIATACDAIGYGGKVMDKYAARNAVLEQESTELRKKLQEAEDRAIRAEVDAAMYKLEALEATTALRITQGLYAEET